MSKYQVIVGNIGTVFDDTDGDIAESIYLEYKRKSITEWSTRAAGEQVTLFQDGEILLEHPGYVHMYENLGDDLEILVAQRREDDPSHCPCCSAVTKISKNSTIGIVTYDDDTDYRLHVHMRCTECGFRWSDVCRVVGATVDK